MTIGDAAPQFSLPATDGVTRRRRRPLTQRRGGATCNHCPYALAWHDRLLRRGPRLPGPRAGAAS